MLVYKADMLKELKSHGYSTYRIRKDRLLSESTVQKLRYGIGVAWENIAAICKLLNCQPGDFLEYVPDEGEEVTE
jgi:putative transcriptional regulator